MAITGRGIYQEVIFRLVLSKISDATARQIILRESVVSRSCSSRLKLPVCAGPTGVLCLCNCKIRGGGSFLE